MASLSDNILYISDDEEVTVVLTKYVGTQTCETHEIGTFDCGVWKKKRSFQEDKIGRSEDKIRRSGPNPNAPPLGW